jgi:hypothetical protein
MSRMEYRFSDQKAAEPVDGVPIVERRMRARLQIGALLLLAGLALAGAIASSAGASVPRGIRLTQGQASKAIHRATEAVQAPRHRQRGVKPSEVTTALLALSRSLPSLDSSQRSRAKALLARPTDSPDPDGSAYTVPEQPPFCATHFCVHYVNSTADAPNPADANHNGVPDYVEQVAAVAEAVYSTENGTLGWKAPVPDGTRGGDSRVDIYLTQLAGEAFGYSAPDLGQKGRSQAAYLVLDNDFATAEFPGTTPLNDIEVTLAHEYNHVLQFGYDVDQDLWFYESTATWMEDHVYPEINDYLRYIKRWVNRSKLPLTTSNIKIYGSAVWNHWLAGKYGDAAIRNAWERAAALKPAGYSLGVYNKTIRAAARAKGRGRASNDLPHEFARFAAATAEWRTPGVFPYPDGPLWQDVKRRGTLEPKRFVVRRISHMGYLLLNVKPRHVKAIRVLAGGQRGTRSAFAVICREGPVATGKVREKMRFAKQGGVRAVTLRNPGRCSRITVALINADPRQVGFAFGDWLYTHDHKRFAATVLLRR